MWIRVWDWKKFLLYFRELRIIIKPIPFSFDVWRGKINQSGRTGYYLIKSNIRPYKIVFHLLREGVNPGNEGRGYVLRRIIRRAVRYAYKCNVRDIFLADMVDIFLKDFSEKINAEEIRTIKSKISTEEKNSAQLFSVVWRFSHRLN